MSNPYFDPTYSSAPPSWSLPEGSTPAWKPDPGSTFSWADKEEKDSPFDIFKDTLAKGVGSYTKRFAGAGEKSGRGTTSIETAGDTVADLGGGNTLYAPDSTAAQMRMAQAGQQGSSGGFGRMAGSILGQAGGAALGGTSALAGTAFGAALGPLGAVAGAALGGLLPF